MKGVIFLGGEGGGVIEGMGEKYMKQSFMEKCK